MVSDIEIRHGGRLTGEDFIAVDEIYIRGPASDPPHSPFK